MVRIIGTIVNTQYKVIGFTVLAKPWEINSKEMGNQEREYNIDTGTMINSGFSNNQAKFSSKGIIMLKGFKFSDLSMKMFNASTGGFTPVDNRITVQMRILKGEAEVGYRCLIDGKTVDISKNDLINLTAYFKGENFDIRTSAAGARFLAGKKGTSIKDIPAINILNTSNISRNTGKVSSFDSIVFLGLLNSLGAKLVYLPSEKYSSIHVNDTTYGDDFISYHIGIANPAIKFSETKINVNLMFKEYGQIKNNKNHNLPAYILKTRTLFNGSKLNIPRLGLFIDAEKEDQLRQKIDNYVTLAEVPLSDDIKMAVALIINPPIGHSYKILEIKTNNISPMSVENAKKFYMNSDAIYNKLETVKKQATALSFLNGIKKSASNNLVLSQNNPKSIIPAYASLSTNDIQEELIDKGVDIYSGMYKGTKQIVKTKTTENTAPGNVADIDLAIDFDIKGIRKYTASQLAKPADFNKNIVNVPESEAIIKSFMSDLSKTSGTDTDKYNLADQYTAKLNTIKDDYVKAIWLNNVASVTLGNYQKYFRADAADWEVYESNRKMTGYHWYDKTHNDLVLGLNKDVLNK